MIYSKELCFTNLPNTSKNSGHNTNVVNKLTQFVTETYPDCGVTFTQKDLGIIHGIIVVHETPEQLAHIMLMFGLFVGEEYLAERSKWAMHALNQKLELRM